MVHSKSDKSANIEHFCRYWVTVLLHSRIAQTGKKMKNRAILLKIYYSISNNNITSTIHQTL